MTDSPEEEAALDADAKAYRADDPIAAIVPCIWDNKQQIYVPVYSHRGVEIKDRIVELEAALREILQVGSATENLALWVAQDIASHALAENKDG